MWCAQEREFLLGYIRNLTKGMSHAEAERHREDQVVVAECREALVKAHKEMEMQNISKDGYPEMVRIGVLVLVHFVSS